MTEKAGQFSKSVVTQLGKRMIVESQNGKMLSFTRVVLGDGLIEDGEDPEKLTAIKKERLSCPIRSFVDKGDGEFALQFEVSNTMLEKGFWHREIGVMAKIGAGAEQLYAYSYAGTAASFLYDKTTPIQERIVKIDVVVGNTENLTVVIDSSIIHPTMAEVDACLTEHNKAPDAHADIRRIIDDKAPIASPALTGTPTVPTASKGTNTDQIASTAFVAQAVAALNGLDSIDGLAKAIEGKIEKQGIVASSLETNGWVKFANGLIVQWGTSMTAKIGTVTFPVSYPQQCFGVQANSCQLVDTNPFKNVAIPYNISTSGFSFRVDDVSNQVQWIAIGI